MACVLIFLQLWLRGCWFISEERRAEDSSDDLSKNCRWWLWLLCGGVDVTLAGLIEQRDNFSNIARNIYVHICDDTRCSSALRGALWDVWQGMGNVCCLWQPLVCIYKSVARLMITFMLQWFNFALMMYFELIFLCCLSQFRMLFNILKYSSNVPKNHNITDYIFPTLDSMLLASMKDVPKIHNTPSFRPSHWTEVRPGSAPRRNLWCASHNPHINCGWMEK